MGGVKRVDGWDGRLGLGLAVLREPAWGDVQKPAISDKRVLTPHPTPAGEIIQAEGEREERQVVCMKLHQSAGAWKRSGAVSGAAGDAADTACVSPAGCLLLSHPACLPATRSCPPHRPGQLRQRLLPACQGIQR